MLSEDLAHFLHGPVFLSVGSRDEKLRPYHAMVFGARVSADREKVLFYVHAYRAERLLKHLQMNGWVAFAAGDATTHESYQLKGKYLSHRPTEEKDQAIQEIFCAKLLAHLIKAGYPDNIIRPYINGFAYKPGVAIEFRVDEVYLQTPGPEAGKKILQREG